MSHMSWRFIKLSFVVQKKTEIAEINQQTNVHFLIWKYVRVKIFGQTSNEKVPKILGELI